MAKFDAEDVIDMVREVMQKDVGGGTTALDQKIAAVEAEKTAAGKGLAGGLESIKKYYEQTWTDEILNNDPAIFFGIEDIAAESIGPATKKTYLLFVDICLIDNQQTNDCHKRIHRYTRALEELFEQKFAPAVGAGQVKITQVRPMAFKLNQDSDEELKIGGIQISFAIA